MTVGKKIKGRKRHIIVDTAGHLLHVWVHAANQHDTTMGYEICAAAKERYPSIKRYYADLGYRGTTVVKVIQNLKVLVEFPARKSVQFCVQAKRWVVERTFAWLGHFRRLAKDYEILNATAENMIRIAMIRLTLAKLHKTF